MKWTFSDLARTVPHLIANREIRDIAYELASRIYSNETWYMLDRDLTQAFPAPSAKISIMIRPIEKGDWPAIIKERPIRRPALEAGLATAYVALNEAGEICYMQWLIDSSQNNLILDRFSGLCFPLQHDEMLLEWAYTFRRFRGLGIMAAAMARISEEGARKGARQLFTFVEKSNIPSLKGCRSAGFRPYKVRQDYWRFFRCTERFVTLPPGSPYDFGH